MIIYKGQSGSALLISLVILVIMTILGISAMSNTVLEAKMANNIEQRQIAFQAAEKALRDAEAWLTTNINTEFDIAANFSDSGALYHSRDYGSLSHLKDRSNWTPVTSVESLGLNNVLGNNPRYIIEYLGKVQRANPEPNGARSYQNFDFRFGAFKITAMGYGADAAATYMLTSTVFRCLDNRCG